MLAELMKSNFFCCPCRNYLWNYCMNFFKFWYRCVRFHHHGSEHFKTLLLSHCQIRPNYNQNIPLSGPWEITQRNWVKLGILGYLWHCVVQCHIEVMRCTLQILWKGDFQNAGTPTVYVNSIKLFIHVPMTVHTNVLFWLLEILWLLPLSPMATVSMGTTGEV